MQAFCTASVLAEKRRVTSSVYNNTNTSSVPLKSYRANVPLVVTVSSRQTFHANVTAAKWYHSIEGYVLINLLYN